MKILVISYLRNIDECACGNVVGRDDSEHHIAGRDSMEAAAEYIASLDCQSYEFEHTVLTKYDFEEVGEGMAGNEADDWKITQEKDLVFCLPPHKLPHCKRPSKKKKCVKQEKKGRR